MFLSPVRVYCAITNPLHFHSGPVQVLYRLVYVAITLPVQTLYDFLTVQYRHCMGHLMAASTMPLRNQNVFFSNRLVLAQQWHLTVPVPFTSTGPVNPQCADRYWACTEQRYETIIRDCTGPLLARYQIVCWAVDTDSDV